MRKVVRWGARIVGAILILLLLAAAWVWFSSSRAIGRVHQGVPERLATPSAGQLADAERQGRILGCFSCHGEGLAGRKMFEESGVATIWAPNLTEVAARASDQQLARAIRQGIGADGTALFVMPSAMYSRLSDQEVSALIALIRAQPRRGEATPELWLGPLGRLGIVTGRLRSAPEAVEEFRIRQPFALGPEHEAGRRLAANACSECHGGDLGGGSPDPNIVAPDLTVAAGYDHDQFRTLMRTGRAPHGRDLGLMAEVARNDFVHLTDDEIDAIHAYLTARAERLAR